MGGPDKIFSAKILIEGDFNFSSQQSFLFQNSMVRFLKIMFFYKF